MEVAMGDGPSSQQTPSDQPLLDTTPYGARKDDSVADTTESVAVTHHTATMNGTALAYTARVGHLVTVDEFSAQPAAKIFYVSFTVDTSEPSTRPVTFFYNGGPGSSSVFLLLGSFGPRRIKTSMPNFTPPAPYVMVDNPDTLLDQSDLVFIDPVGTGYSAAISPRKNGDFWGVDEDARSIKQFVKRYLTKYNRWNSPKFLFGESYGTPRTCVLTWLLHEDGVDLNGVVLQSSILDYSQTSNAAGLLPTLAADAWFHHKVTVSPAPSDLSSFMKSVETFARGPYASALAEFPNVDDNVLRTLSELVGIPPIVLKYWNLDLTTGGGSAFLTSLLHDDGVAVGAYDGRVTAYDTGIAGSVDPNSGGNDPTMTAVAGVYTAMWNVYLNDELRFTSTSPFVDLNDQAFLNWNFGHIDPTGAQKGGGNSLYTAGDLAAAMALNPYLQVFSANGYYDAVTPFFQTVLNFENMPLKSVAARHNLTIRNYPSGHMVYLDEKSRSEMKSDLAVFYQSATARRINSEGIVGSGEMARISQTEYRRRISRVPY
jgi:carboxypeptidase C (cathepsin A)